MHRQSPSAITTLGRNSNRDRTMTGGSCSSTGSFASYSSPTSSSFAVDPAPHTVSMERDKSSFTPIPSLITPEKPQQQDLLLHLRDARRQATEAKEALERLSEGVRIITRQLKRMDGNTDTTDRCGGDLPHMIADGDDLSSSSSSCNSHHPYSDDRMRLEDLIKKLQSSNNNNNNDDDCHADMLAVLLASLDDAAQMVSEHASLASQEADILVSDVQHAHQVCHTATHRAEVAEHQVRTLQHQCSSLDRRLQQARAERKVLIRQVKKLMLRGNDESAVEPKLQQRRAVELHVLGALQVHERLMGQQQQRQRQQHGQIGDVQEDESSVPVNDTEDESTTEESSNVIESAKAEEELSKQRQGEPVMAMENDEDSIPTAVTKKPNMASPISMIAHSWSSSPTNVTVPSPQDEKEDRMSSLQSAQENSKVISVDKNVAYVPVKLTSARPVTPVSSSSGQDSTTQQDLSPSSGLKNFFQRPVYVQVKRPKLKLDKVPILVGHHSALKSTPRRAPDGHESRSDSTKQRTWSDERSTPAPCSASFPNDVMMVVVDEGSSNAGVISPLIVDVDSQADDLPLDDDDAFRSLSLPRIVDSDSSSTMNEKDKQPNVIPRPTESSSCPPEIRQIFQEIGTLYEC